MQATIVVSWVLAFFTAAGTITLAFVGLAQHRQEQRRRKRENTPMLLLTGARAGREGEPGPYTADLANLSSHWVWLDGIYVDWWEEGDWRLPMTHTSHTNFRTPVKPGDWVTLEPFPPGETLGNPVPYAEIVVKFHYAPTGTAIHSRAWGLGGRPHSLEIEDIDVPNWFIERPPPR